VTVTEGKTQTQATEDVIDEQWWKVNVGTVSEAGEDKPLPATDLPELRFVHPLPGFPGLKRYVLVRIIDVPDDEAADGAEGTEGARASVPQQATGEQSEQAPPAAFDPLADGMLYELRSVDRPELRFLVGVPGAFFPEYQVELDDQSCDELQLEKPQDALVLVILNAEGEASDTTANLLAPVVINAREMKAAQVILSGTDWPVRAKIA